MTDTAGKTLIYMTRPYAGLDRADCIHTEMPPDEAFDWIMSDAHTMTSIVTVQVVVDKIVKHSGMIINGKIEFSTKKEHVNA